ncbi:ATP-binding cassette domain-containing protein (plasmid) [Agrobacterium leguminum]|uniref:Sugar ABC transporter, ATP-binding protein n=1 Tax=Agrobacterium deltaense NCPPB 1641 TaxID=1183425 RepID=A0A1S7UBD3_9HYPH|nr:MULTISPECIES: ATP-binding cassette domain-containing protein [Agrobacterium]WFS69790.1 ATP-binding cassette domain-containing protein [Agrobacterium leguminum]CVI64135.1 Sugar ABC transporter, ATP-binding protein [Agrobacterium deltaense NCPPB 1641]
MTALIELREVSKRFGGIVALTNVSIKVAAGEILCLLGDNGAGKSTLIKVLSGFHAPSTGEILLDGAPTHFADPREARSNGIATVHQDVGSIPLMSVGRNFFLGAEPIFGWGPFKFIDMEKSNRIAVEEMRSFGITRVTSGDQLVGTLSGGERQVLAIARAMYFGARVLILDEPTSALGVKEAAKVLAMVKVARKRGVGIVFITHNARHAMLVGDSFVVLAHGTVLAKFRRGEKTRDEVLNLMAGGDDTAAIEADLASLEDDAE